MNEFEPIKIPVEYLERPFAFGLRVLDAKKQVIEEREYARFWLRNTEPPHGAYFVAFELNPPPTIEIPPKGAFVRQWVREIEPEEFSNCPDGVRQIKDW